VGGNDISSWTRNLVIVDSSAADQGRAEAAVVLERDTQRRRYFTRAREDINGAQSLFRIIRRQYKDNKIMGDVPKSFLKEAFRMLKPPIYNFKRPDPDRQSSRTNVELFIALVFSTGPNSAC
jgi:hypothetical protein